MLFRRADLDAIAAGRITVAFRRWRRPTVKPGGTLHTRAARLARLDGASSHGPWTESTLRAISASPGVRAADLADGLGREKLPFKADVRKLKALGLTESLERGYRLSPRGRAWLSPGANFN